MTMNENSVGDIFQIYEVRGVPVAGAFDAPQRAGLPREAFEGPSVTERLYAFCCPAQRVGYNPPALSSAIACSRTDFAMFALQPLWDSGIAGGQNRRRP